MCAKRTWRPQSTPCEECTKDEAAAGRDALSYNLPDRSRSALITASGWLSNLQRFPAADELIGGR